MKEQILNKDKMSPELKKRLDKAKDDIKNGNFKSYSTVDELFADMEKRRRWWHSQYYACVRFFDNWINPSTWAYRIHRWYLWLFIWGFNPKDIWSLDYTMSKWIVPRLKRLKEVKHGVPTMLYGDEELLASYEKEHGKLELDKSEEEAELIFNEKLWKFAMDKMIKAFELTIEDVSGISDDYKRNQKQMAEGLEYFVKYFNCLWD